MQTYVERGILYMTIGREIATVEVCAPTTASHSDNREDVWVCFAVGRDLEFNNQSSNDTDMFFVNFQVPDAHLFPVIADAADRFLSGQ
jgi:hypothetical protein